MVAQQTSLDSYMDIMMSNLSERYRQIMLALGTLKRANNLMIAKSLKLPINCVTPRVNELRKKGIIVYSSDEICPYTKRRTMFWRLSHG